MAENKYKNKIHNTYDIGGEERPYRRKSNYKKSRLMVNVFILIFAILLSLGRVFWKVNISTENVASAEVVRVVDGDTIIVLLDGKEQRVRMIGVDCPESVSENVDENTVYGVAAANYTKERLKVGMTVYLTFDEERQDKYQRMLAYIWTDEDVENIDNLFQKQLVDDGFAVAVSYEPNTIYSNILKTAMIESATDGNGLWAETDFYEENHGHLSLF